MRGVPPDVLQQRRDVRQRGDRLHRQVEDDLDAVDLLQRGHRALDLLQALRLLAAQQRVLDRGEDAAVEQRGVRQRGDEDEAVERRLEREDEALRLLQQQQELAVDARDVGGDARRHVQHEAPPHRAVQRPQALQLLQELLVGDQPALRGVVQAQLDREGERAGVPRGGGGEVGGLDVGDLADLVGLQLQAAAGGEAAQEEARVAAVERGGGAVRGAQQAEEDGAVAGDDTRGEPLACGVGDGRRRGRRSRRGRGRRG